MYILHIDGGFLQLAKNCTVIEGKQICNGRSDLLEQKDNPVSRAPLSHLQNG